MKVSLVESNSLSQEREETLLVIKKEYALLFSRNFNQSLGSVRASLRNSAQIEKEQDSHVKRR